MFLWKTYLHLLQPQVSLKEQYKLTNCPEDVTTLADAVVQSDAGLPFHISADDTDKKVTMVTTRCSFQHLFD